VYLHKPVKHCKSPWYSNLCSDTFTTERWITQLSESSWNCIGPSLTYLYRIVFSVRVPFLTKGYRKKVVPPSYRHRSLSSVQCEKSLCRFIILFIQNVLDLWCDNPNNTNVLWRMQTMKLLVIWFFTILLFCSIPHVQKCLWVLCSQTHLTTTLPISRHHLSLSLFHTLGNKHYSFVQYNICSVRKGT